MLERDWSVIDKRASQATDNDAATFEKLVKFLEVPVKNNPDRDIYMTRGLLYWLKCNSHQTSDHGMDSPLTLATKMFAGKVAYADTFTNLCQLWFNQTDKRVIVVLGKANIQCETVSGISKTGDYNPGDLEIDRDKMQAYWNKVCLLGKWWPIHPRYVLRTVKAVAQPTGSTRKDSDLGDQDTRNQTKQTPQSETTFNNFWFLTSPEIFLNKCYPDKAEDQLLPVSKRLKRPRQFMKLPYLTPIFHEYNLKMTSEESCVIDTIDGIARISFKTGRPRAKDMTCDCTLSIQEKDGGNALDFETSRLVFCSRKKGHFIFEVRCPVEGIYQLVVNSRRMDSENKKVLLKTKIVCQERMAVSRILPVNAGNVGWGFGPVAANAGLSKPKVKEPKVFVKPQSSKGDSGKTAVEIKFVIEKDAMKTKQYDAELIAAKETSYDLKDYVKTSVNTNSCELRIVASVPVDGEYALVIKATDKPKAGMKPKFEPVCTYLLTTLEDEEKMSDEYYDSSDGTSDLDEEIDHLQEKLMVMTAERDKLKTQVSRQ